jgi:pyruvyl transferase EpsO
MRSSDLIARLSATLRDRLAPAVARGRKVALVDFPDAPDCGGYAIWLGEKALLAALGAEIAYACSAQSYNRDALAASLGDGIIFVHGRENAGAAGALAERLRNDFPNHKILMPADDAPDASVMLGMQERPVAPVFEIVWIGRTDSERANDQTEAAARLSSQSAEKFELPVLDDGIEMHFAVKQRPPTVLLTDWTSMFVENVQNRNAVKELGFDARARAYVRRAMHMLSLGHVVVTDRLHAHILCLELGIPHVLLNNRSGSNWTFHQRWTRDAALVRFAATPSDAWGLARNALVKIKELEDPSAWSWQRA